MPPFRLHSKYNPHKEAKQFAGAIEGNPAVIVITEPGESYLAPVLKLQFPQARRIALRYTDTLFADSDNLWDAVWRPKNGSLSFFLLSHIPDEKLPSTRFLSWKAADSFFPDVSVTVWKDIRYAIDILTSVMHTRSFFGNKWLKNTVYNFIHLTHPAALHFGTKPFILAGAGPSLQSLHASQAAPYSVIAVGSAYAALAARSITIDLCVSADAGYWALRHFDGIPVDIPVAFPLEAAVPAPILTHNPCIPLSYSSPLETALFTAAGFSPIFAHENGTVTGTACELLLTHTQQSVILAGVDLAASKGFSHAQPHSSAAQILNAADKVHPLAGALAVRNFQTQSLETYRQWFLQLPSEASQRLLRAGTDGAPLPNIKTIKLAAGTPYISKNDIRLSVRPYPAASAAERARYVRSFLQTLCERITTLIETEPIRLTDDTASLEKQLCALCGYTDYCNTIKNIADRKAGARLKAQVDRILSTLIKKVEP